MSPSPEPRQEIQPAWAGLLNSPAQTHIHLVGIGGAGLSAIARLLIELGFKVSGSDQRPSAALVELAELGATVMIGHQAENVAGAQLVLISSAVPADNPEVLAAQAAACPVVKREQFLAPRRASTKRSFCDIEDSYRQRAFGYLVGNGTAGLVCRWSLWTRFALFSVFRGKVWEFWLFDIAFVVK